jgi:hypothetical protein
MAAGGLKGCLTRAGRRRLPTNRDVVLVGVRHNKSIPVDISLTGDGELKGISAAGTGARKEPKYVALQVVIDKMNDLFGADSFTQSQIQEFVNGLVERLLAYPDLVRLTRVNTKKQFMDLDEFQTTVTEAVVDNQDAHNTIADYFYSDGPGINAVIVALAAAFYEAAVDRGRCMIHRPYRLPMKMPPRQGATDSPAWRGLRWPKQADSTGANRLRRSSRRAFRRPQLLARGSDHDTKTVPRSPVRQSFAAGALFFPAALDRQLAVGDATGECPPLDQREHQYRAGRVLGVPDGHDAREVPGNLDAVAAVAAARAAPAARSPRSGYGSATESATFASRSPTAPRTRCPGPQPRVSAPSRPCTAAVS